MFQVLTLIPAGCKCKDDPRVTRRTRQASVFTGLWQKSDWYAFLHFIHCRLINWCVQSCWRRDCHGAARDIEETNESAQLNLGREALADPIAAGVSGFLVEFFSCLFRYLQKERESALREMGIALKDDGGWLFNSF